MSRCARCRPARLNLHGHLHEGTEPTARHINLTLEQLGYSPAGLTWVLAEARRREWLAGPAQREPRSNWSALAAATGDRNRFSRLLKESSLRQTQNR